MRLDIETVNMDDFDPIAVLLESPWILAIFAVEALTAIIALVWCCIEIFGNKQEIREFVGSIQGNDDVEQGFASENPGQPTNVVINNEEVLKRLRSSEPAYIERNTSVAVEEPQNLSRINAGNLYPQLDKEDMTSMPVVDIRTVQQNSTDHRNISALNAENYQKREATENSSECFEFENVNNCVATPPDVVDVESETESESGYQDETTSDEEHSSEDLAKLKLPAAAVWKHLLPNCRGPIDACRFSRKRRDTRWNHVFRGSNKDFIAVVENSKTVFTSTHPLKYWKCKYLYGIKRWKVVENGEMIAVFNKVGHLISRGKENIREE